MKNEKANILRIIFLSLSLLFLMNSCSFGAKENYLGNNLYLSEYDNVDRRILYQTQSYASTGIEIVPMTVLEIAHNEKWIIAKTGYGKKRTESKYFKYWSIKNDYEKIPDSETVKSYTNEFNNRKDFEKFLTKNNITLELGKID